MDGYWYADEQDCTVRKQIFVYGYRIFWAGAAFVTVPYTSNSLQQASSVF